jgi:hypothetical protein
MIPSESFLLAKAQMQTAFLSLSQSASSFDFLTQMHLVSPVEKNVFVHLDVESSL